MEQHIISAWLLRAFARRARGDWVLHVYDKVLTSYADSIAVEQGIGKIEGPAARAASNLAKRAKGLPGGLYAIVGPGEAVLTEGPALSDKGVFEGMRLLVSQHQLPSPSASDRLALANYAGLMYERAPKLEAALVQWGVVFGEAAQAVLDRLVPGMHSGLSRDVSDRRTRMLGNARNIGPVLARANWWIARAGAGEAFVLGDNPVATTISLGHDDSWRPILAQETYVVAMPIGPAVALVIAPRQLMPVSGIQDANEAVQAINRLVWRSADRYVLARNREQLDEALPGHDDQLRRSTIPVDYDPDQIARSAIGETASIVSQVLWRQVEGPWQRWVRCRLTFGYAPFAAGDREFVMGPAHNAPPRLGASPQLVGRRVLGGRRA
jgi:hypothetical protein